MENKKLIHLYQKLIESHSSENELFNARQYACLLSNENLTPSMIADIRYSEEYLSLLTTEKAFNKTYEALTHLYNREKGLKNNKKNLSNEYQEWMFEKIFTKDEKQAIKQMVTKQFGGEKNKSGKKQKMVEFITDQNKKDEEQKKQKNLFCEMLELIFCEDEIIKKRKITKSNNQQQQSRDNKQRQFSVGKILDMMF